MKTRKIGLANYLAYGSGDFLGAGTTALTAAWLLYFYTTFCGLTPIEATFIFAMGRDLDYYRQIPLTSMPYGQAMAILCLSEYLRVYL